MDLREASSRVGALRANLERAVRGKPAVIDLAITALLAKGHLLIEDVPGVGKSTLAHGLAKSLDCSFQRIQFTSDLLPSDIVGVTVFNQAARVFEFRPGPVFANIVLADEINRATPKTQSALLEAMNERQVSVDRATYPLPSPFMLLATQNPIEFSGTFPLPESQLDRFMICLRMGYPDEEHERSIIKSSGENRALDGLGPVLDADDVEALQAISSRVRVDEDLVTYILSIASATRSHRAIRLGVSPRAAMAMYRAAQALALASGRDYCIPDDIKTLSGPVFAHRIIPAEQGLDTGIETGLSLIKEIVGTVKIPL
ncbi:MAG: AAA family ATPase [Deltaproteobacteria bacterium]|nr:AAA family ATPase [Deltaproteobacteria bacterium]MBZ0219100.1 AAA family ATPase [Deltaproteobacteria bacterium]